MTDIHGDSIWTKLLWGSSLTAAAMTGYARVKAGKHYPTDIIASAVVGFAIGYLIPTLHKKKKNDRVSLIISPNRIGICLQF
jgi:membrane-associated phospholipid phosphatase